MNSKLELKLKQTTSSSVPVFFDLSVKQDCENLENLLEQGCIQHIIDDFEEQNIELFAIMNPSKIFLPEFKDMFKQYYTALDHKKASWQQGKWVYFPWQSKIMHILDENEFCLVRSARNEYLITREEQKKFYYTKIGIAGLSVGTSVALATVLQGGCKYIKLADMDQLALTNTNRILSGIGDLGLLKVEMAARRIYEMNPYSVIEIFPKGLTIDVIQEFFNEIDIMVDEVDNLAIKFLIREEAKKRKIPIVMAADSCDSAVVDIERYDQDPNTPFFHGRLGDVSFEDLKNLDKIGIGQMITKHVGKENITDRMILSLKEIGKSVVSWPQLGGTAMVSGAAVAYCLRKIANNQPLENNRAIISLNKSLTTQN